MPPASDPLSSTFAALADPTRRAILARLREGDATVNELAEPFAVSLQAISNHLRVLEHAGLISRGRAGQFRPSKLETASLRDAGAWLQGFWEGSFDQLEARLKESDG